MRTLTFAAMLCLLALACSTTEEGDGEYGNKKDTWSNTNDDVADERASGGDTPTGPEAGGDGAPVETVTGLTLAEIQQDPRGTGCNSAIDDFIEIYASVSLTDLQVVSGTLYVSETLRGQFVRQGEGAWSGMLLTFPVETMPDPAYMVGDVLTVTGTVTEAYCMTQLQVATHQKTGERRDMPQPVVVAAADVAAFGGTKAEELESVYLEVQGGEVTEINAANGTFVIDGKALVDDSFQHGFYPKVGCKLTSVRGVLRYHFGEYKLLPLGPSDIAYDAANCELQGGVMTIQEVQTSPESAQCSEDQTPQPFKGITLEDVVIASGLFPDDAFHVYFGAQGEGPNQGIEIRVHQDVDPGLAVGDVVTFTGSASEYYCATQFTAKTVQVTSQGGAVPAASGVTVAQVNSAGGATTEPYEGCLVALSGVTVSERTQYGDFYVSAGGAEKLLVDNRFGHQQEPPAGCQIDTLTGFVRYGYGEYKLEPRAAADIAYKAGSACEPQASETTLEDLQLIYEGATCDADSGAFVNLQDGVMVKGVVVTSPRYDASGSLHGYFVSDLETGIGILLVIAKSESTSFPVGAILDITGNALEYYCMTQIQATEVTQTGTHAGTIPATTLTKGDFLTVLESYEGAYVTLESAVVTDNAPEHGAFLVWDTLEVGTLFHPAASKPATGTTLTTLRGVLRYAFGHYILEPTAASDLAW